MEPLSSATLEQLSGLLATVETSAKSLREFLQSQRDNSTNYQPDIYSARIAQKLELPLHVDSNIVGQASVLRVACEQLARLVTPPRHLLFETAGSFYTTLALQIVLKHDIATAIKTASKDNKGGVSAGDLALKCKLDADLLARVLRYLSQRGIFQELEQGIFANTVASSTLVDNPEFRAHLDLVMHEGQLAAPFFEQFMKNRFTATHEGMSTDPAKSPMSAFALFSGGVPCFPWLHLPENADRAKNFHLAMRGMSHTEGLDFLPVDYPFGSLSPNTTIVDVGGGIGSLAELLLPEVPDLRFVIQDLEAVVALANEVASPRMKGWITEGKVKFQAHDMFTPHPPGLEGAVFVLKTLIHNHDDPKALKVLTGIRSSEPSKLLIIDRLVTPVFRTEAIIGITESGTNTSVTNDIQTSKGIDGVPVSSQGVPTMYDIIMASLHGGRERMLEEWQKPLLDGGFKLLKIYPLRASTGQVIIEAVPV